MSSQALQLMSRPRLLGSSLVGAADQALLSAFNLAVGLAFIRFASKSEYATYALAFTVLLLLQSVQSAIVNSPLATLSPAADRQRRLAIDTAGVRLQRALGMGVLFLGLALAAIAWIFGRDAWAVLLLACTVSALGLVTREYHRAQCFLRHDAWAALRADALYSVLAIAGIAMLLYRGWLSAVAVLATIGVAGLVVNTARMRTESAPADDAALADASRSIWSCARWALPSVVNSWLYANAYLFLVERLMSKDAVADLSASRLLLVPLSLLAVGWSSAFRPRASQWMAAGDVARVHQAAVQSAWAFVAAGLVYGGLLWAAMPLLQAGLLGEKYITATALVVPWLAFFTIASVRTVGMSSMLASAGAFKTMYGYSWVALSVSVPALLFAGLRNEVALIVSALAATECVLCAIVWFSGWPKIKHQVARDVDPGRLERRP